MFEQELDINGINEIDKSKVFALMGKLNVFQRNVLSLKYLEGMSHKETCYILGCGHFKVLFCLMITLIELKLLLIINNRTITLENLIKTFGKITSV